MNIYGNYRFFSLGNNSHLGQIWRTVFDMFHHPDLRLEQMPVSEAPFPSNIKLWGVQLESSLRIPSQYWQEPQHF